MNTDSVQRGSVILNNLDRLEELNTRIAFRNMPSTNYLHVSLQDLYRHNLQHLWLKDNLTIVQIPMNL